MIFDQILPQDRVQKAPMQAILHTKDEKAYKILSIPYLHRDEWYINVVDIFSLKNHSIKLEDIKNFSILGKLSQHFTKIL